jgi:23S rRNA A2030 N6-methylase RlmJ
MGLKFRPVPKDRVRDYAENISQVLDAKEISHDFDTLLDEVEKLNNSENQGKQDSHVFAPAIKSALDK